MSGTTEFENTHNFARHQVTLANWRLAPYSSWSFQNVSELVPTAKVFAGSGEAEGAPRDLTGLLREQVTLPSGQQTISEFLERTHTDALTIMKAGDFVGDWSAPHMRYGQQHIAFSVSKSLTAIVAGTLIDDGVLDPEAPVLDYLPETAGSAYGDASVRHVLDMTVSLDIEEAYLDPQSPFARYRRAMLWNPGGGDESLYEFLCTLKRLPIPHGEIFRYRSPNTDLLGVLLERASDCRMPDLMRDRLWSPLGARSPVTITVDREGISRASAGVSLTPRDLARVGEMMRQGGMGAAKRVVSEAWVLDTISQGSRQAWLRSDFAHIFPEGRYRNKWYQTGTGAYCGIGIHGQWLFVDPVSKTVVVKMSSQPEPVTDAFDYDTIAFMQAVPAMI